MLKVTVKVFSRKGSESITFWVLFPTVRGLKHSYGEIQIGHSVTTLMMSVQDSI